MRGRTTKNARTPFGERLAAARLAAGLSQTALAKKLGVNRTVVRHNERNVADPKLKFLLSCCSALSITLDELIDAPAAFRSERGAAVKRLWRELSGLSHKEQHVVLEIALTTARAVGQLKGRKP